jgi:oxygen-dependent protoporphyrinogen oxidase
MRVGVIGGGLSGLTTAFHLQRARPEVELVVVEAEPRLGGKLRTVDVEGFRFECGANGFLTSKPDGLRLAEELAAQSQLLPSSDLARKRFVYTDAMHRLPESPALFLKSPLLNPAQKLRVLGELFVPPRRDGKDETLREFGDRRLGRAFTDVFLDAMTAGVSGSTPEQLSVRAAFPLVVELEQRHGGLFRGMFARRRRQAGPGGILMSYAGGISTLVERLRESLRAEWHVGDPALALEPRVSPAGRRGWLIRTQAQPAGIEVDRVAVCATADSAAGIVRGFAPSLAERLGRIAYTPISIVGFGYRRRVAELDGFGVLTTKSARQPVLGVLWDSSIFPDRAPPGAQSLRVMIGGLRNPELALQDEAGLFATARRGLAQLMQLDAEPDVSFSCRWDRGIPNYPPGHLANVEAICALVDDHAGLYLGGNAYRGIAMNDCMRNGRELGERIAAGMG